MTVLVPLWGPLFGLTAVTVGGAVVGVGVGERGGGPTRGGGHGHRDVPDPAGTTTLRLVPLVTSTAVPTLVPKSTVVEPETNPEPATVTVLVPAGGPLFGVTEVTVGGPL